MKREIKFRAWHPKEREMIYPYVRSFSDLLSSADILREFDEVMEFTGLYDKLGIPIYEGDVIFTRYGHYIVTFNNGGFQPLCGDINAPKAPDEVEVIGHIYQMPEL